MRKVLEAVQVSAEHVIDVGDIDGRTWKQSIAHLANVAGFDDALYVANVIDAIRRSATDGRNVHIKTPTPNTP